MKFIKREFPEDYRSRIVQLRKRQRDRLSERLTPHLNDHSEAKKLSGLLLRNEFFPAAINHEIHLAWQGFLRSLHPAKPVLLDIVWVMERRAEKGLTNWTSSADR